MWRSRFSVSLPIERAFTMKRMFNNACIALYTGVGALAAPALSWAQEQQNPAVTVTELVDPDQVQAQLTANLSKWIVVGIGIGISVFIVYLGWRLLKRFTRG